MKYSKYHVVLNQCMVNETILRRLAYVKSLYNIAKSQYRKHSDIEISRGLVSLDNCIEAYLWVVLEIKIPNKINSLHGKDFVDLINESSNHISNLDINGIRELHKARNNIQHNGLLIAESQAKKYFILIDDVFTTSCSNIFGISWKDVSLSMLIEDRSIAKLYMDAENYFNNHDYRLAAKNLIIAFETAKTYRQASQFGSGIFLFHGSAQTEASKNSLVNSVFTYAEKIEEDLEVLKMGLEYSDWRGYRLHLGNMNPRVALYNEKVGFDENSYYLFKRTNEEIETWVRKNLSFVLETILRWERSFDENSRKMIEDLSAVSKLLDEFS